MPTPFLLLLALFQSPHASAAIPTATCVQAASPAPTARRLENEIEEALDRVTPGDTLIIPTPLEPGSYRVIRALDVTDPDPRTLTHESVFVAEFSFKIRHTADGLSTLSIENARVAEPYRKLGIYKLLFAQVLKAHPEIQQIEAMLILTNYDRFERFYRALPWWNRFFAPKLSTRFALAHTPAYQIREKFGFTRLVSYKIVRGQAVHFTVRREDDGLTGH